jgi:hypothetical protein
MRPTSRRRTHVDPIELNPCVGVLRHGFSIEAYHELGSISLLTQE